jgi:hypothetical protein
MTMLMSRKDKPWLDLALFRGALMIRDETG